MNTTGKLAPWVCIFSTLLVGCYTSELIDPNGGEKEKVYHKNIECVFTNNGTKYVFEKPPAVISDAIVGEGQIGGSLDSPRSHVSIPLADVSRIAVSEFDAGPVLLVLGATIGGIVAVFGVIAILGSQAK